MIDRQNAVQMVHFVLNQFGERAFSVQLPVFSGGCLVAQLNPGGAFQPDHEIGERETVVPETKDLTAFPNKLRVDEFIGRAIDLHVNDAGGVADLDRADAASEAVRAAEFGESVAEVVDERLDRGGAGDGLGDGAQEWVAEEEDTAGGHDGHNNAVNIIEPVR